MGIVDADALPASEKPSPAAPSAVKKAGLVVRFCFEACLTRGMVASSKKFLRRWQAYARPIRCTITWDTNARHLIGFPFIFMNEIDTLLPLVE